MTEDEAKTKWCPYTFMQATVLRNPGPIGNCIASGCMAWRIGYTQEYQSMASDDPPGAGWTLSSSSGLKRIWTRMAQTEGYCGLAGRP
jgi:hypothetical protein